MINCAHPTHFEDVLEPGDAVGATGSAACARMPRRKSHAELDEATELDDGDPADLGERLCGAAASGCRELNVLGGCCGTDHRHVTLDLRRLVLEASAFRLVRLAEQPLQDLLDVVAYRALGERIEERGQRRHPDREVAEEAPVAPTVGFGAGLRAAEMPSCPD